MSKSTKQKGPFKGLLTFTPKRTTTISGLSLRFQVARYLQQVGGESNSL